MKYVGVAGLHAMCYLLGNSMNDQNLLYISYQMKFHTEEFFAPYRARFYLMLLTLFTPRHSISRYNLFSFFLHNNCVVPVIPIHDDVIKWKHFPRYWPFVRGIHRSPVNSPHKGQWRGDLMFSLICAWINDWVNNRGWWFETPSRPLWRHGNVWPNHSSSACRCHIYVESSPDMSLARQPSGPH